MASDAQAVPRQQRRTLYGADLQFGRVAACSKFESPSVRCCFQVSLCLLACVDAVSAILWGGFPHAHCLVVLLPLFAESETAREAPPALELMWSSWERAR